MDHEVVLDDLKRLTEKLKQSRQRLIEQLGGGDPEGALGVREPNRPRTPPLYDGISVDLTS
jgi:hypothetical protein